MNPLRCQSLSARIWWMLIGLALTLILCLSGVYSIVIRSIETNYTKEMLKETHLLFTRDITYEEVSTIGDVRTLAKVQHLLVHKDAQGQTQVEVLSKKPFLHQEDIRVIASKVINIIDAGIIQDTCYAIPYTAKGVENTSNTVYVRMSQIEGGRPSAYIVSYIIKESRPLWHKEFGIIVIGFIIGSFGIAKAIAHSITKPLKALENHAFKIANKEWVAPLIPATQDEIGSLIASVNYMQEELQKKDRNQQTFLQSVSHDLKTPIMVIEGHAQAIRDEMYVESLDYTAEIILKEAQRLGYKVQQMLDYNTLDYTLDKAMKEEYVSLDSVVSECVEKFRVLGKHLVFEVDLVPITYTVNREQMAVAIENLLDNQLRYAKQCITVSLSQTDGHIKLQIGNDGPQIAPETLQHMFEQHYKESSGNFGLGLAIAKKIVCYYGGTIQAKNCDQGVLFEIDLDRA